MPARGNISPQQIVDHDATTGHVPIYDAFGCLVDSGVGPGGGGVFPVSFPNVPGEFLNSYDDTTGLFTAGTPAANGTGYGKASITPLTIADWSTLGSGGTRTDLSTGGPTGGGAIAIISTTGGSGNVYGVSASVSAGDFTKLFVIFMGIPVSGLQNCMVGFTDGTKVEGIGLDNSQTPTNIKISALSAGTYAGANGPDFSVNPFGVGPDGGAIIIKLTRTGTALAAYWSMDGGVTYTRLFNDTSPYLTASAVAVWTDARGSANASRLTLVSYA